MAYRQHLGALGGGHWNIGTHNQGGADPRDFLPDGHGWMPPSKRRRLTQFSDEQDFFRAATDGLTGAAMPGFNPVPRMDQFGTVTNLAGGGDPARLMRSDIDSILSNSVAFDGLNPTADMIPQTFNTNVFGSSRAMTQVTTSIQVRPLFQTVNGQELVVNFRYGDPVFIWIRAEDRQLLETSQMHFPNTNTAVNYDQLRAFEAAYLQYSYDTPAAVGVRSYRAPGPEEQELVDERGNTVENSRGRPGVFERWRFIGVCVSVDPVQDMFPMITVCTQGPARMLNIFSRSLRIGTDLFFRELHVENRPGVRLSERQIHTTKTLMAWPPHAIVSRYERWATNSSMQIAAGIQPQAPRDGDLTARHYGPYRILEPSIPSPESFEALGFRRHVHIQQTMCVIGRVLDVEPTATKEPGVHGGWPEGTSVYSAAEQTAEGLSNVYHGYILVDLRGTAGLMIDDAVATLNSQGFVREREFP